MASDRVVPDWQKVHGELKRKGVTLRLLWEEYWSSEPELNPTYHEMALHYGVAVLPARVRKPCDKAKVESGVLVVERRVLAPLRNRTFFSLTELNEALRELLVALNNRPLSKLPGSRRELFDQVDRPAMRPLPVVRFVFGEWRKARVNIDRGWPGTTGYGTCALESLPQLVVS